MTARQYERIEAILSEAEDVTTEHPLLTPQGHSIQAAIRTLLALVGAEKALARELEGIAPRQDGAAEPKLGS